MVRSYKCTTQVTIHSVSAPGTWLPNRDDVYLTIELFNQVKRTRLTDPIFPLIFHDRFTFEKIFWTASDPLEVTEILEDLPIVVELRQVTDVYLGGALLAYFDSNARDFLSPYPTTMPRLEEGRELIMCRTVDFTGISPKLEFSTYTLIECFSGSYALSTDDQYLSEPVRPNINRRPRSALRSQSRSRSAINNSYDRQTVSSALRSRSPSPVERMLVKDNIISQSSGSRRRKKRSSSAVELRPPFVVRKVDPTMLLRQPKFHDNYKGLVLQSAYRKSKDHKRRSASPSFTDPLDLATLRLSCDVCNITKGSDMNMKDLDNAPPESPSLKFGRDPSTQRPIYEVTRSRSRARSITDDDDDDEDIEVANINHRPVSPVTYYPSLRERYSPILNSTSERISRHVHSAHMFNRSPLAY